MSEIEEKVIAIVAEVLQLPVDRLTSELTMGDIVEWDSLRQMLIVVELEKRFSVTFDVEQLFDVHSIGDFVTLVQSCNNLPGK